MNNLKYTSVIETPYQSLVRSFSMGGTVLKLFDIIGKGV